MSKTKRRSPGDGSLFKRSSDGLWVGSVEVSSADGKRRQKRVSAKTYKAAKAKHDELRADIAAGRVPISDKTTVETWLGKWLDIQHGRVAQKTYKWYEEAVRLHVLPNLDKAGKLRLKALTAQHVRNMLEKVNTTANQQRAHKTLNLALKKAVADGILARNVMDAVDKPGHTKRVRGALDADAAKTLIRAAIDQEASRDATRGGPLLATRWAAGFLTGARPAELRGLEWERVDFDRNLLDVSWQLKQLTKTHGCAGGDDAPTCGKKRPGNCPDAYWYFAPGHEYRECHLSMVWTRTKTEAGTRVIPLVPALAEMLSIHRQATAGQPNPHGLVWHHGDGRPITETDENRLWHEFLVAAGMPRIEQYAATRHTASTLLQALGVPDETRMKITGHSSAAAHQAYIHVDQAQTRAALDKLARQLLT